MRKLGIIDREIVALTGEKKNSFLQKQHQA